MVAGRQKTHSEDSIRLHCRSTFSKFETKNGDKTSSILERQQKSLALSRPKQNYRFSDIVNHRVKSSIPLLLPRSRSPELLPFRARERPLPSHFSWAASAKLRDVANVPASIGAILAEIRKILEDMRKFIVKEFTSAFTNLTDIVMNYTAAAQAMEVHRVMADEPMTEGFVDKMHWKIQQNQQIFFKETGNEAQQFSQGVEVLRKSSEKLEEVMKEEMKNSSILDESEDVIKMANQYIESIKQITQRIASTRTSSQRESKSVEKMGNCGENQTNTRVRQFKKFQPGINDYGLRGQDISSEVATPKQQMPQLRGGSTGLSKGTWTWTRAESASSSSRNH